MAITLEEASKLSNDMLKIGVIETIIKDSPILQRLPFIEIVGNSLIYNQEKTLPGAKWYDVNEEWATPTPPTFEKVTAELKILGENADIDAFLKATRSNVQDLEATVIELTTKAITHEFEDSFIYGTGEVADKDFKGLRLLIDTTAASDQVITMGGTGATLTLAKLDELIDAIKGGKSDMLLMSRRSRRKLNALVRAAGSGIMETDRDKWGNFIQLWDGIPIGINDWILNTHVLTDGYETATTGGDCSTIYAMQFGEGGLCGLTAPGHLTVEPIGALEARDATRTRIKWYVSLALFSSVKVAALIGVTD